MSRYRPLFRPVRVAALATLVSLGGLSSNVWAGPLQEALQRELEAVRDARELLEGSVALEREQESLAWAQTVLEHRGRESLRRLDAYRVSRDTRRKQARARARSLYKLARGGMLRIYLEEVGQEDGGRENLRRLGSNTSEEALGTAQAERTADRVTKGRTLRWLVRHDLSELRVHTRAEDRSRAELLAATRELAAISSLRMIQDVERHSLREATADLDPQLRAANKARKKIQRKAKSGGSLGKAERHLLAEILRGRSQIKREKGRDMLGPSSLRRPTKGRIVGRFGTYEDPVLRLPMSRNGIELGAGRRERVRAIAPGVVALVGSLPGFGDVVVIDHGEGYVSLTARLQGIVVEEGQEVQREAILGRVAPKRVDDGLGRTVYFELRHAERPIDPGPYLTRGRSAKPSASTKRASNASEGARAPRGG